jgi:large subunit ribosomal protein L24
MHVKKEDLVLVLSGNHRGKKGKILKVFPKKDRAIVEGLNMIKKHTRPSAKNPQGGIVEKEASIDISNLMVICPKCNQPTKIKHAILVDEASKRKNRVRVCKKCDEMLIHSV